MEIMGDFITQIYQRSKRMHIPTVFLDRDGTIVEEVNNLTHKDEVKVLQNATEGIRFLNKLGYQVLVVTNQPVVARGWITELELRKINNLIQARLEKAGALISAIYSCPHHPKANIKKYRIRCSCRKPGILMYQKAASDFQIDFQTAYLIGDRTADIKAGENLNIKTILVKTGYGGSDRKYQVKPNYKVRDLLEAAKLITQGRHLL